MNVHIMKFLILLLVPINCFAFLSASDARKATELGERKKIEHCISESINRGSCMCYVGKLKDDMQKELKEEGYSLDRDIISWCDNGKK